MMPADAMHVSGGEMAMSLAANDAQIAYAIEPFDIAQNVPGEVRGVRAEDIGMPVQNRSEPSCCGASPGNYGKNLGTRITSKMSSLALRKSRDTLIH